MLKRNLIIASAFIGVFVYAQGIARMTFVMQPTPLAKDQQVDFVQIKKAREECCFFGKGKL